MQVNSASNNITRLYGSIYARLLCKPGKKAACLREGDYEAGHAITHVQTHVQSTVFRECHWSRKPAYPDTFNLVSGN